MLNFLESNFTCLNLKPQFHPSRVATPTEETKDSNDSTPTNNQQLPISLAGGASSSSNGQNNARGIQSRGAQQQQSSKKTSSQSSVSAGAGGAGAPGALGALTLSTQGATNNVQGPFAGLLTTGLTASAQRSGTGPIAPHGLMLLPDGKALIMDAELYK